MKKINLLATILILILSANASVFAQEFSVRTAPVKDEISILEEALFNVTINNNQVVDDTFTFSSLDTSKWRVYSDPVSDYLTGKHANAKSSESMLLYFKPLKNLSSGIYQLDLKLSSSRTGESLTLPFIIKILPLKPTKEQYNSSIGMSVYFEDVVDPRRESKIVVDFENKANAEFKGLILKVRSINSSLVDERLIVNLGALEKRKVEILLKISSLQEPISDILNISLATPEDEDIKVFQEPYRILGYTDFSEERSIKKGFLTRETVIKTTNRGNQAGNYTVKYRISLFESSFARTNPTAYYLKEGSLKYLAWNLNLKSLESKSVIVRENYAVLLLVFVILCVGLIIYFVFRIPIVITKKAKIIRLKEGGISELKVVLHIKNRGPRYVSEVKLIDSLPNIAEIEESLDIGPLKPEKVIRQSSRGTIIKWDLGVLDKFEERIISYKVKSKLSILGWFTLPPAIVKYKINNKEYKVYSKRIKLGVEEEKRV
ncbi:MAG: hypothetical protein ACPLWC_02285 [Candidatus Woesearchaeota archaeon]